MTLIWQVKFIKGRVGWFTLALETEVFHNKIVLRLLTRCHFYSYNRVFVKTQLRYEKKNLQVANGMERLLG